MQGIAIAVAAIMDHLASNHSLELCKCGRFVIYVSDRHRDHGSRLLLWHSIILYSNGERVARLPFTVPGVIIGTEVNTKAHGSLGTRANAAIR